MKILHLLQSNRFSGAENVVCQIFGMQKNNPDLEMVYCSRDGQIRESLKEKNIPFVAIKSMSLSEVKRVIREQKPDIIHAHDRSACVLAALACGEIPVIAHMHVNNNKGINSLIKNLLWILTSGKFRQVFFVSDSSYDEFQFKSVIKNKSLVLYNVIDIDALYAKAQTDDKVYDYDIVYVGRLTYQKNPERLMEVLHKVVNLNNNVKVAIAGNGEYSDYVESYRTEKDLIDNIHYLGFISNPVKLIQSAKVLVMTSRFEGTPMTALEAQCLGVPVVSTPVDGLIKVIEHGNNGYLSDDNDELVKHITDIMNDDDLLIQLRENSVNKSKVYNNIDAFYDEIKKAYLS